MARGFAMLFLAIGWVFGVWVPSAIRRVPTRISFDEWMERYDPAHDFLHGEDGDSE